MLFVKFSNIELLVFYFILAFKNEEKVLRYLNQ